MKFIREIWGRFGTFLMKAGAQIIYRPVIVPLEGATVTPEHPVIFISNHVSCRDAPMLMTVLSKTSPYALAAKDWYDKKILTPIMEHNHCIPVDRHGLDTAWLHGAVDVIKSGHSFLIFPEGHTSSDGELDEFKSGFLILAMMTGAKIVPVYNEGRYNLFCRNKFTVGAPASVTPGCTMTADSLRNESERFRRIIEDMMDFDDDLLQGEGVKEGTRLL